MKLCSCGRNPKTCPGPYSGDVEHDNLVLAKGERAAAGKWVGYTMDMARLAGEIDFIKKERLK